MKAPTAAILFLLSAAPSHAFQPPTMDRLRTSASAVQGYFTPSTSSDGDADAKSSAAVEWSALPQQTRDWIAAHPYQSAFYAANGAIFLAPAIVTAPLLGALGFTAAGPAAGTAAAATQAVINPVVGGSVFATLQSAAMGGYGAAVVAGGAQAGSAVASGAVGLWSFFGGGKKEGSDEGDGKKEGGGEGDEKREGGGEGDDGQAAGLKSKL